ncbi:MAG: response regulator [Anaerolineae bacterium]|nr:response regulator [Anaerolineae bacterium]
MPKSRILVVEDDADIANMLRIYFDSQGYETHVVGRGLDALEFCRRTPPNLIILDIRLPDIDGYEVCRSLRNTLRTSHIPILFLTQKDERSDKIAGLQLGADDYITKPFDIEELRLRVQNVLRRATYESQTNPVTGLPSAKLIEEQLKRLLREEGWHLLYIGVNQFEAFTEEYGFVAADDVLRFTAMVLGEAVSELGTLDDFVGHVGADDFLVITWGAHAPEMEARIRQRFAEGMGTFYSFRDRERGYMVLAGPEGEVQVPLMSLAVGRIASGAQEFADIREITEAAADARRKVGET